MPYKKSDLPTYPVNEDVWSNIKNETRPIVIYGMGNGADKLFDRLSSMGVTPADIFASDGFVRGHSFRGMRVKSFSEIKEAYTDFVILLSFASNREEVVDMLFQMDENYDMYVPDMPIAGVDEYFDKDYYNTHYEQIVRAYSSLCDEDSKNAFSSIIRYKLSGRISYLRDCYSTKDELYSLIPTTDIYSYLDLGAYNGDTMREALQYFPRLRRAVLVEPDGKNYKRLRKYVDTLSGVEAVTLNSAVYSAVGDGVMKTSGNRNSTISSTSSYVHKDEEVSLITVDSLNEKFDYIKYDVEGTEYEALIGSDLTVENGHPTLLVSLYHRSRDIFFLINFLNSKYPEYKMYLRRLRCIPAWEVDLILVAEK